MSPTLGAVWSSSHLPVPVIRHPDAYRIPVLRRSAVHYILGVDPLIVWMPRSSNLKTTAVVCHSTAYGGITGILRLQLQRTSTRICNVVRQTGTHESRETGMDRDMPRSVVLSPV